MKSIGQMLEQCDGLRDTKDISHWENTFLTDMLERYLLAKKSTSEFSDKQVEIIHRIYNEHFA
jgi:hypothetical protein